MSNESNKHPERNAAGNKPHQGQSQGQGQGHDDPNLPEDGDNPDYEGAEASGGG